MDRVLDVLIVAPLVGVPLLLPVVRNAVWPSMLRLESIDKPNPNTQIVFCSNGAVGTGK